MIAPVLQTYLYDMQNDVMGAIARAQAAFEDAIGALGVQKLLAE